VTLKNKYGYGLSFIPGLMLSDHTMIYARAGVVRTRFEDSVSGYKNRKTLTGGQVGLGLQTSLTQNVDLRGEYDFTTYGSQTIDGTKIKPRTDTFTLGLIYKFD
jgi:opacity protein-like surface antigen